MKHVFLVHSHITWIVVQLIVDVKKIDFNEIIVFRDRHFEIQGKKYNHLKYENKIGPESLFKVTNQRFDELIEKNNLIINDEYLLYIPTSWAIDTVALIGSGLCRGFYYFEEGLSCYVESNFKRTNFGLIKNLYYKFRFKEIYNDFLLRYKAYNVFSSKFLGAYALHEESFKYSKNREILSLVLKENNAISQEQFDVIVVFDGLSVFNIIQSCDLLNILKEYIIPFIKDQGYGKVAYKMHPEHNNDHRGKIESASIIEIFAQDLPFAQMLTSDVSVENYIFNNNKTDVITYVSSLTLYSYLFGAKVFTVHNRVKDLIDRSILPDFLLKQVTHI